MIYKTPWYEYMSLVTNIIKIIILTRDDLAKRRKVEDSSCLFFSEVEDHHEPILNYSVTI
jgi:hypothetical protein